MEDAVTRTPTEIWRAILEMAIKARLAPSETNDSLQDMQLFEAPCKSYGRLVESERIRTKLRLVCRSWNEALKDMGDRSVVTDWESNYLPSKDAYKTAARIEVYTWPREKCKCAGGACRLILRWNKTHSYIPCSLLPANLLSGCEVLNLHQFDADVGRLAQNAPSLRALSWEFNYFTHLPRLLAPDTLQQLTHLCLHEFSTYRFARSEGHIAFPELQMLWIDFIYEFNSVLVSDEVSRLTRISKWKLPKLQRLRLTGECDDPMWDDIKVLLPICGSTITELIVTLEPWDVLELDLHEEWIELEEIQREFTNLTLFGTTLRYHSATDYPLKNDNQHHILDFLVLEFATSRMADTQHLLSNIVQSWHPKRIVLDESWEDARCRLEGITSGWINQCLQAKLDYFQFADMEGVSLCDVDGVSYRDSAGQSFKRWVEIMIASLNK